MPDVVPYDIGAMQPVMPTDGGAIRDPEEQREAEMVLRLYERGKKSREQFDKDWTKFKDFYEGRQWDQRRPSYKASPVANICRQTVQTILPILTDAQPGFNIGAKEPSDYDFADFFSEIVPTWWQRGDMNLKLLDPLMDEMIYGIGYAKVVWDPEAEEGAGDVVVGVVDPTMLYFPEGAKSFEDGCPWVIQEIWKPLGEIKRKFPDRAELIQASGKQPNDNTVPYNTGDAILSSPIDRKAPENARPIDAGGSSDSEMVCILEAWMDDYSIEEYEAEDGERKTKLKYPAGKVVKVLKEQKVLLESVANPRKDGRKPFVRFIDTVKARSFVGEGEIGPLMETNKLINKSLAHIVDSMNMTSNPVWVTDTNSGVLPQDITNQIGLVITKNPGTDVHREPGLNIPPFVLDFYNMMMSLASMDSGIHDVTQGRKPQGITAAAAINDLQEAAQTRLRLKERNLQVALTQMGYLVVATMMQYYKEPRVVKLTGKKGWPEYMEFYLKEDDEGKTRYVKRKYTKSPDNNKFVAEENWTEGEPSKGLFDIEVVSGSSLPFMKEKRSQLALTLFDKQVIDKKELLEILDWPRKDEILRRDEEAQAAAGAAAGAVPPPGGGAVPPMPPEGVPPAGAPPAPPMGA